MTTLRRRWTVATPMALMAALGAGCALLDGYGFSGYVLDAGSDAPCAGSSDDSHNCGTCGHDCLGGACVQGTCQPWAIAQAAQPFGVAVRGNAVFFTTNLENGGVYQAGLDGAASTIVAPSIFPFTVATDSTHVYWTSGLDGGLLQRCPLAGCGPNPELLYGGADYPYEILLADAATYWTVNSWNGFDKVVPDAAGGVWLARGDAGGAELIANQSHPYGIATDGAFLYWADDGPGAEGNGSILRANLDGTGAVTIASGQAYPQEVAVYDGQLYWSDLGLEQSDGSVMTCSPSHCNPTPLADNQDGPLGLGVDDSGVYWTNSGGGTVIRCQPVGPTCMATSVAEGQDSPYDLALDGVSIYWTDYGSGAVMRLAK
jgi:hypothetical protein